MGKEETPPCRTWELMTHFPHKETYSTKNATASPVATKPRRPFGARPTVRSGPGRTASAGGNPYGATVVERVTVPLCPCGPVEVVVLVQVLVTGSHCPCDVRLTLAPPGPVAVPLWV